MLGEGLIDVERRFRNLRALPELGCADLMGAVSSVVALLVLATITSLSGPWRTWVKTRSVVAACMHRPRPPVGRPHRAGEEISPAFRDAAERRSLRHRFQQPSV